MFARLHTLETTRDQEEQGLRVLTDEVLPWLRESTGFRGLIRLVDRGSGKVLTFTFWANEESLRESAEPAARLGELVAAGIGAAPKPIEEYEVRLFDVET